MRILQIRSGYSFNGAVRYAAVVSRLLALRGHEVILLQRPGLDVGSILPMLSNIEIQLSSLRRVPEEIRRLGEFCRRCGIDAIHTPQEQRPSVRRGAALVLSRVMRGSRARSETISCIGS